MAQAYSSPAFKPRTLEKSVTVTRCASPGLTARWGSAHPPTHTLFLAEAT